MKPVVASFALALSLLPTAGRAAEPKVSAALQRAVGADPYGVHVAWVFFKDRGPEGATAAARDEVSARAWDRRARRGEPTDPAQDQPPLRSYVDAVRQRSLKVRHESRWFNAVSVEATARQIEELAALPFVTRLERVRRLTAGTR
jgi:hypothetical protein